MAFQEIIKLLTDGVDRVDAGTLNVIFRALSDNLSAFRDLLSAAEAGAALYARDVAVKSDVLEGQPVYWNSTNQRFEKALAAAETVDDDLVLAESAKVWGVVYSKTSTVTADLVLSGYVQLDLSNAITGDQDPGLYYLSASLAGKLTQTMPAVSVAVLQYDGSGYVNIRPSFKDALETFATVDTTVTSLVSLSDQLIITCATDDSDATTGPLQIELVLDFTNDSSSEDGHNVLKRIDGNNFLSGPVVEGLLAGTNISLSSTDQNGSLHQGQVTVSADIELGGKELIVETIRLSNTEEEYYKEVAAIGFESGITSSLRGKLYIPDNTPDDYSVKLRVVLLGRASGTLPAMTMTYRRLPKNADLFTDETALPTSDTSLTINTAATITTADNYVTIESEEVAVSAGDIFLFSFSRAFSASGPDVFLLDIRGVLVEPEV